MGLADLLASDRRELLVRWRQAFRSTPPKHSSTLFLQKVLAHDLQCKLFGDVPRRTQRYLNDIWRAGNSVGAVNPGVDNANAVPVPVAPVVLIPGIELIREWNGRPWRVEVLDNGFACNGQTYRSLSAIARMITGTRWSGPRFFGVRR